MPPTRELFFEHQLLALRVTAIAPWLYLAWGYPPPPTALSDAPHPPHISVIIVFKIGGSIDNHFHFPVQLCDSQLFSGRRTSISC